MKVFVDRKAAFTKEINFLSVSPGHNLHDKIIFETYADYSCFEGSGTIFVYSSSTSHFVFSAGNHFKTNKKFDRQKRPINFGKAETTDS